MRTKKGHLSYCTNIHAGNDWESHFSTLKQYFPYIKKEVSPDAPMGIGLRLSNEASMELVKGERLSEFVQWLEGVDGYVFTMNGFPYGNFHHTVVKDQVHAPDWTSDERLAYTLRLFAILEALLPEGMDGGISTSPLSYRHWFHDPETTSQAKEQATRQILLVVEQLIRIRNKTLKILHLDIEPEPDGLLETGREFISWYTQLLLPMGSQYLAGVFKISLMEAEKLLKDHVRLCYDVCHFALGYEKHDQVISELGAHGIEIGKIQISAALKADLPHVAGERRNIGAAFSAFNEPVYLHQVIARSKDQALLRYRDLPDALEDLENQQVEEWRAHFHVPLFIEHFGVLESTQDEIIEVLRMHEAEDLTGHLEVETYTWEVLPQALKLPIEQSIARELTWVKKQIGE